MEEISFSKIIIDEILVMENNKGSALLGNTEILCEKIREIRDDLVYVSKVLTAVRKKAKKFYESEKEKKDKGENANQKDIESKNQLSKIKKNTIKIEKQQNIEIQKDLKKKNTSKSKDTLDKVPHDLTNH